MNSKSISTLLRQISAISETNPGTAKIQFKEPLNISERGKILKIKNRISKKLKSAGILVKNITSINFDNPTILVIKFIYDQKKAEEEIVAQ